MAEYSKFASGRQVGLQAAVVNLTLWLLGGQYLDEHGSTNSSIVPALGSIDLNVSYNTHPGPNVTWQSVPADVPNVAHGYLWSDLVGRAWHFGGRSALYPNLPNTVWRYEPGNQDKSWTLLDVGPNITDDRPSHGAGCNVPELQTGYYLGGMIENSGRNDGRNVTNNSTVRREYIHVLHIFNTHKEIMSVLPVPEFVPVVNQSMVWIDTGNSHGALVVLGGSTDKNGTLEIAPLTSYFLFDISAQQWILQDVTDTMGDVMEANGLPFEPAVGIPRRRYNACAVAGSAQDKTSHNIYLFGGENATHGEWDIWVLSLPSGIWIKAPLSDQTNGPKADSSCILLNQRYVLMFGGCFHDGPDPDKPCASYSYNPLNYNIQDLDWIPYWPNWVGYFVPANVSKIIGGNELGNSPQRKPMFKSFSDPALTKLFTPPAHRFIPSGEIFYDLMSPIVVPSIIALPVVMSMSFIITYFARKVLCSRRQKRIKDWRPWVLSISYLLVLNLATVCLIGLILFLALRSRLPDPDPEHWPGGLDLEGTWLDERFAPNSRFIRAPGLNQPPQGLISTYYDTGSNGTYNQKNFTIRVSYSSYWVFTYLPMLIAVIYGRMWKVLDDEVMRLDTYFRLYGNGGTTADRSLCLSYPSFWTPLSIVQALRYRHWTVAISNTGNMMGSIVLPVVQNYVFIWQLYSGGALSWPNKLSWALATIEVYWWKVLAALLGFTWLCALALLILLPLQDMGLSSDPGGLATVLSLLGDRTAEDLGFDENADWDSFRKINSKLRVAKYQLIRVNPNDKELRLERCQPQDQKLNNKSGSKQDNTGPAKEKPGKYEASKKHMEKINRFWEGILSYPRFKKSIAAFHEMLKSCQEFFDRLLLVSVKRYLLDHSTFFMLRNEIFIPWLMVLVLLLAYGIYLCTFMKRNADAGEWNYDLPLNSQVYLVLGIFIQSIVDLVDRNIRILTPLHALHQGFQHPRILWTDYTRAMPLWDIFIAHRNGDYVLWLVMLANLATSTYTIFLGSLQLSKSYYGATNFASDYTAAMAATVLIAFVLVVMGCVWWVHGGGTQRKQRYLVRPPDTLAATLAYLVYSPLLRTDLQDVREKECVEKKIEKLENQGRRYGYGVFKDCTGKRRVGVERHYTGLDRWSNIGARPGHEVAEELRSRQQRS